jgi:DNA-binding response OmpR family regulator
VLIRAPIVVSTPPRPLHHRRYRMADSGSPRGLRVLIVEDEALIGLTLADILSDRGFHVFGPVRTQSEAFNALEQCRPEGVILDLKLADGVSQGLAQELRSRGTPFVVFSGYPRKTMPSRELQEASWIEKPGPMEAVIQAVSSWPLTEQPPPTR